MASAKRGAAPAAAAGGSRALLVSAPSRCSVAGSPTCSSTRQDPAIELLSCIDNSPLLLHVLNCPALSYAYDIDGTRLEAALRVLLAELPLLGARVARRDGSLCLELGDTASVLMCEAWHDGVKPPRLHDALAAPWSVMRPHLPAWWAPTAMDALLSGREPLVKLLLTHTASGGCVLGLTMPHLLCDSHSSTLMLTRLAHLYRQQAGVLGVASGDAAEAAPPGNAGGIVWAKAALLPPIEATPLTADRLHALGLKLQSVDRPRPWQVLRTLAAAVSAGAKERFPGPTRLSSLLLEVPGTDLQQLKALASPAGVLSTNDVLSALVWVTYCSLRGRPLPGSGAPGASSSGGCSGRLAQWLKRGGGGDSGQQPAAAAGGGGGGVLGMALDLRHNCSDLQLTAGYFGNAAWCIHIPSTSTAAAAGAGSGAPDYAAALRAAAASVRAALVSFRAAAAPGATVLQLVAAQQAAPLSVTVRNLSRLATNVDAFITSWAAFDVGSAADFGGGAPCEYACALRPTPPWQAAILPRSLAADGGVQLLLTVPASAVQALRASSVLRVLVPGARVVGGGV